MEDTPPADRSPRPSAGEPDDPPATDTPDLSTYARDLVATWPPLTDQQRARLALLLRRQ